MAFFATFLTTIFALLQQVASFPTPRTGELADMTLHPPMSAAAATTVTGREGLSLYDDTRYAAQLHELVPNITVSNGPADSQHCKSLVYQTFSALPARHTASLASLDLSFSTSARRGLSSGETLQLRCTGMTDSVLVSVLAHEIGHLVDIGGFQGDFTTGLSGFKDFSHDVYENDPSVEFYRISWLSDTVKRQESTVLDFVSGYAMNDPFEDFAEAYNWYVLQGANFRHLAQTNSALRQKYDFLKAHVFDNREFGGKMLYRDSYKRVYDSTLLPYSLRTFLSSVPENSF